MSKFVDKVKKSGETYEIHDSRIEDPSALGGTKLYKHTIPLGGPSLIVISTISKEVTSISELDTLLSNSVMAQFNKLDLIGHVNAGNSETVYHLQVADSTITSLVISSITSDTVTEL